ncbi:MAG: ribbon-helix-helix domain-containing protein [Bdellovibrionales bacterium]
MIKHDSVYNVQRAHEEKEHPRSTLISRNVVISGRRTSVRLEPEMWDGLREICQRERSTLHQICTSVSLQKLDETSLTAAIRVFVMRYFRLSATEEGHAKAGHGYGLTLGLPASSSAGYERSRSSVLTRTSFA